MVNCTLSLLIFALKDILRKDKIRESELYWYNSNDNHLNNCLVLHLFLNGYFFSFLKDFGQHGREPITCEVALKFLETLVGEKNDSISPKQQMALNSLLPHMVIKVNISISLTLLS